MKGFVQDVLKQLGAGGSSFPQQIIQLGMQGAALITHSSSVRSLGKSACSVPYIHILTGQIQSLGYFGVSMLYGLAELASAELCDLAKQDSTGS